MLIFRIPSADPQHTVPSPPPRRRQNDEISQAQIRILLADLYYLMRKSPCCFVQGSGLGPAYPWVQKNTLYAGFTFSYLISNRGRGLPGGSRSPLLRIIWSCSGIPLVVGRTISYEVHHGSGLTGSSLGHVGHGVVPHPHLRDIL